MGKKTTIAQIFSALILAVALFLLVSWVFMELWNRAVMKAFRDGTVKKIKFETAMGLVVFIGIFFSTVVVRQVTPLSDNLHSMVGAQPLMNGN